MENTCCAQNISTLPAPLFDNGTGKCVGQTESHRVHTARLCPVRQKGTTAFVDSSNIKKRKKKRSRRGGPEEPCARCACYVSSSPTLCRYCNASAICDSVMESSPARSAIVRATLIVR